MSANLWLKVEYLGFNFNLFLKLFIVFFRTRTLQNCSLTYIKNLLCFKKWRSYDFSLTMKYQSLKPVVERFL